MRSMAILEISYKPTFIRQLNKLDKELRDEAIAKTELFKQSKNHISLAVHKLRGQLRGRYGFSVNFKYRIVFQYLTKTEVVLLTIGDHEVYK